MPYHREEHLLSMLRWLWRMLIQPEPGYLPVQSGTTLHLKGVMPALIIEVVEEDV
jgi:hypothetical protein